MAIWPAGHRYWYLARVVLEVALVEAAVGHVLFEVSGLGTIVAMPARSHCRDLLAVVVPPVSKHDQFVGAAALPAPGPTHSLEMARGQWPTLVTSWATIRWCWHPRRSARCSRRCRCRGRWWPSSARIGIGQRDLLVRRPPAVLSTDDCLSCCICALTLAIFSFRRDTRPWDHGCGLAVRHDRSSAR